MRRFVTLVPIAVSLFAQDAVIRMDGGVFRVTGWHAPAECGAFKVYAGTGDVPAVVGSCSVEGRSLVFRPRYPLTPGMRARAFFRPAGATPIEAVFEIPKAAPRPSTTSVTQVYPTAAILPENQLKLYVYFSAPMQKGEARQRIHLLNPEGKPVDLPFLELDQELWNPDTTRLTILFDPGRIKRGVKPLEEVGPAIEAGKSYTLVIDRAWLDGNSVPLTAEFRKQFRVRPADREPIDPATWRIAAPRAASRDALILDFPKPLDYALLQHLIAVKRGADNLPGSVIVLNNETEWRFLPQQPWTPREYTIVIQTALEDLAGNKVGRAFDVDTFDPITRVQSSDVVSLPFRVRQ